MWHQVLCLFVCFLKLALFDLVMDQEQERIKTGCQKILEGINSMSLVNLDDQQVHSLVMMRELARGVVDDRDRKVREISNDLIFVRKIPCLGIALINQLPFLYR